MAQHLTRVTSSVVQQDRYAEERKMKIDYHMQRRRKISFLLFLSSLLLLLPTLIVNAQTPVVIEEPQEPLIVPLPLPSPTPTPSTVCTRTIKASVVALDQAIMYNRLGAMNPGGMIYALKQDVVPSMPRKASQPATSVCAEIKDQGRSSCA